MPSAVAARLSISGAVKTRPAASKSWLGLSGPSMTGTVTAASPRPRKLSSARCNTPITCAPKSLAPPIGIERAPVRVGAGNFVGTDAVVVDAAEIENALVLADRGDHRVVLAAEIPQAFQHLALLV